MITYDPAGAHAEHPLWPDMPPAHDRPEAIFANPGGVPERWVRNVTRPSLTEFRPETPDGRAVLVVPGGAFHFVSIDNEGYDVANALALRGVTAFVLKYRVAPMPDDDAEIPDFLASLRDLLGEARPGQPEPPLSGGSVAAGRKLGEEDGRQAMRLLRAGLGGPDVDPARIGVLGFSAGGGIAVDLALAAPADCRPAFAGCIYPAYRPVPVPADAAPMFLATAADDPLVAPYSAARLAEAAHRASRPAELHIYAAGGHGFGIRRQNNPSDIWFADFCRWMDHTCR